MNKTKRITFGIGIVLVVLVVLAAPAMAHRVYFEPHHSNATTDDTTVVNTYFELDADETLLAGQLQILFDASIANVTGAYLLCQWVDPTGPNQYCWGAFDVNFNSEPNGSVWGGVSDPQESKYYDPPGPQGLGWYYVSTDDGKFHGPITVEVSTYEVKAHGIPDISPLDFGDERFPPECPLCQECMFCNGTGITLDVNWEHGTFMHIGPPETFEKELVTGWNLISLPLTPLNNSTDAVLGNDTFTYDAVYRYNAVSKQFEDVTAGTMDPGTGYFMNVTTAGTWSYEGTAYTSMSVDLKQGLNLVGWLNTSAKLPDAFDSIAGKYNYVVQWNATDLKYEVYDANAPVGLPEFIDFTTMERGTGYWIAAKDDCTL